MFKMKTMVLTITIVVLALFLAGNHALAATFSDVPANHWAKSYIDRCTSEGIIKGYPDNTFRPSNEISFTEISSLLSGLLNVTESEMQAANTTYGQKIIQLNVPDWARPAVLKCLYKGVYSLSNLETAASAGMLDDTKGMAVSRANCAVFFSQAMGLSSQMGTTGLTYHDLNSISESARPHIVALQKVGVLSAQGDGYGYFHPMNGIDRASIAKMLTVAIDYLKKNPGTTPTPTPTVSIKTVSGHVKNISSFGGQNYIIITKSDGKDEAYSIDVSTKVTVDTLPAFVTQIKEGMEATITYDDTTKKATVGIFKTAESKVEGIIKDIPQYGTKLDVEYTVGSITKIEEFNFSGATITLDGKKSDYRDLKKGYEVTIYIKADKVTKVEAKKTEIALDGYFVSFNPGSYNRNAEIEIEEDTTGYYYNRNKVYPLARDYVYINGSRHNVNQLTDSIYNTAFIPKGMPVRLKFNNYDEVTEIETVFNADIKDGVIYAYIHRTPAYNARYLEVSPLVYSKTRTSDVKSLNLPRDTYYLKVYRNNTAIRLEDLRYDEWVKISMRGGEVDMIEVVDTSLSPSGLSRLQCECYDIDTNYSEIHVRVNSQSDRDRLGLSDDRFVLKYDVYTKFLVKESETDAKIDHFITQIKQRKIHGTGTTLIIEFEYDSVKREYRAKTVRSR